MDTLTQDLRHAVRSLTRTPGLALLVTLILALGIGGTAVIFGVVNAVLIRPLPYPHSEQLARAYSIFRLHGNALGVASPPDFVDWRARNHSFGELAATTSGAVALTGEGPAEQVPAAQVTGGFFAVMGVAPALGRGLTPADDSVGGPAVAVLSDGLWRRRFGGASDVIGRAIRIGGNAYQVAGVMPPGFDYPDGSDLWLPLRFSSRDLATQRGAHYLDVVGRLRPGMSVAGAAEDLAAIERQLGVEYPTSDANKGATVSSLRTALVGDIRRPLLVVLAAMALVLLIACINVAGLLVVRSMSREREYAVRAALGAGRGRLVCALLVDGAVLALVGGVAGLLLASWGISIVARYPGAGIPFLREARLDPIVILVTLGATLLTAAISGLLPAFHGSSLRALAARLKGDGRTSTGGRGRTRNILVILQTAVAVVLLAGAGLLFRSLDNLRHVQLGFDPSHLLTFTVSLPSGRYSTPERVSGFEQQVTDRLRALPGVRSAGAIFGLPLTGFAYGITPLSRDGIMLGAQDQEQLAVQVRIVTPDLFRTMAIGITAGRAFTDADRLGTPQVMIVNQAAARLLWPGTDPLGHRLFISTHYAGPDVVPGGEVVGVVGDIRDRGLRSAGAPTVYLPLAQNPTRFLAFAIKAAGDPILLATPARAALQAVDPDLPPFRVRTMDQLVADDLAQPRLYAALLITFAAMALTLAGSGLYGVLAQSVVQRSREIGVRRALGATARDIRALVLRQGVGLSAIGIALGIVASLGATRALRALLYDTSPADPATLGAVGVGLTLVAILASWLPARRATKVDPMVALRAE